MIIWLKFYLVLPIFPLKLPSITSSLTRIITPPLMVSSTYSSESLLWPVLPAQIFFLFFFQLPHQVFLRVTTSASTMSLSVVVDPAKLFNNFFGQLSVFFPSYVAREISHEFFDFRLCFSVGEVI